MGTNSPQRADNGLPLGEEAILAPLQIRVNARIKKQHIEFGTRASLGYRIWPWCAIMVLELAWWDLFFAIQGTNTYSGRELKTQADLKMSKLCQYFLVHASLAVLSILIPKAKTKYSHQFELLGVQRCWFALYNAMGWFVKRLDPDVFHSFTTLVDPSHDVTDTKYWVQNGNTRGRVSGRQRQQRGLERRL